MMSAVFDSILWLIVAIGILVTFHEFGHFWVARKCGVKVLRFSVGFGKPLWSRFGKDGTEYAIAAIPLGGYVSMLDEREQSVPEHQLDQAFNRKTVWQRIAIVAAGPIANLIFTLLAFWLMFVVGIAELQPRIDTPQGIAAQAGLARGDIITDVGGDSVESWTDVALALSGPTLDRARTAITVQRNQNRFQTSLSLNDLPPQIDEERILQEIGLSLWQPVFPALVGDFSENSPALAAGMQAGDRILMVGDQTINRWSDLGPAIADQGRAGARLQVIVERAGESRTLMIVPQRVEGKLVLGISIEPKVVDQIAPEEREVAEGMRLIAQQGPLAAIPAAFGEMGRLTSATLGLLGRMVTGDASLKNLSGPITIAQFARDSAQLGLSRFLFFLGLLSLSLAILNFLPVPMLDGGHLLYYLVEVVKGSPVSEQTQMAGQYIGLLLIFGLISLTFYNDILRLLS